jgi:hypothetical protein
MAEAVEALLKDERRLREVALQCFNLVDTDQSGFIDEGELATALQDVARALNTPIPTKTQVRETLYKLDSDRNGRVSSDEFIKLLIIILKQFAGMPVEEAEMQPAPKGGKHTAAVARATPKRMKLSETRAEQIDRRLEQTGVKAAFMLIFAEVCTKQVDAEQCFEYTASRLRQLGQEATRYR